MSEQALGDVRLRLVLRKERFEARWPENYRIRSLEKDDARVTHQILVDIFEDEEPDFDVWYASRFGDGEYDPALNFVAEHIPSGDIHGLVWCWSSKFIKDLAVLPAARRRGLAQALMFTALNAFAERGTPSVDLKTNRHLNAAALQLYESLGMREVDWGGGEAAPAES